MSKKPQDYMQRLAGLIKNEDCEQANIVLCDLFGEQNSVLIDKVLAQLRQLDEGLITCLSYFLAHNGDSAERFPVVEELLFKKILLQPERIGQLLVMAKDSVEIAYYVRCIDMLFIDSAAGELENKLGGVTDEQLIIDILEVLTRLEHLGRPNDIADFLYSSNRSIITAAICCLGATGSHEAIQILYQRMGTDSEFDRLILDQFALVQDQFCLDKLNDTLASHATHIRNYGKEKLVDIGFKAIPIVIENLISDDDDFVIHSLNVLCDINDESAIKPIRNLILDNPTNANIRFAAYEALGRLPCGKVAFVLAEGLSDADDSVRTAAARAINNNYSRVLSLGVKNLLRSSAFDNNEINSAIVESESDRIFIDVIDEEDLRTSLFAYIKEHAHSEVATYFSVVLKKEGHAEWAQLIADIEAAPIEQKILIYAVDDSRMVLNIYRKVLHDMGCDFKLFEFPEVALRDIAEDKPSMVFTDLNMPDISGIDLTNQLRETYSKEDLPIVMVTTQGESDSQNSALDAGVNEVLSKPFTAKSLQKAIDAYL